jgi:hydrogenase/urease accessory protein HupE
MPPSSTQVTLRRFLHTAFALLCAWLCPTQAVAHTGGSIGFATVVADGREVRYELVVAAPVVPPPLAATLRLAESQPNYAGLQTRVGERLRIAAPDGPCQPLAAPLPVRKGDNVLVTLRFECPVAPARLTLRDDLADLFGSDYHTLANIAWQGGNAQLMFQPDRRDAVVVLTHKTAQGAASFFTLGMQHILIGFDHLLFLLALILRGGDLWSLLRIITAFTVAHSITLGLAALNIIVLPARLVEGAIALSIAYVAAENLLSKRPASHRWAVSFAFGLVHGVGFSSVLRELGLPQEGLLWTLLSFNLGVEAGQAIAVIAALPLLLYLKRSKLETRTVMAVSTVVLLAGVALFIERAVLGASV